MRGRTNADAGIQLNAIIDTYEVASGENIVAGDFVEQYISVAGKLNNAKSGSDTTQKVYKDPKIYKMSDNNYFGVGGSTVNLYNDNDGIVTKVWAEKAMSLLSGDFIIPLSNNCLLGDFSVDLTSKCLTAKLVHYNPSDNTIESKTISSAVEVVYISSNTPYVWIVKSSNGGFRVFVKFFDANDYIHCSTGLLTISGNSYSNYSIDVSSLVAKFTDRDMGSDSNRQDYAYVVRIDSNETYLIRTHASSTLYQVFSNNTYSNITLSDYTLNGLNNVRSLMCENSTVDFLDISDANNKVALKRTKVYFNPSDPTIYNISATETVVSENSICSMRYIGTQSNKDFYILFEYTQKTIRLITVNVSDGSIESLQPVSIADNPNSINLFTSLMLSNEIMVILGATLYLFKYVNGNLEDQSRTVQRVRGITSQNYIKGVAKQSGTAGDQIEVYIPQVSS